MPILENKIDFAVILSVSHANPNGDPLNGNRPREDYNGYGEISDVCLKRKIRNRMMDMGYPIFVQSDDRCADGFRSLHDRADAVPELKETVRRKDQAAFSRIACEKWLDVRSFGQVFAFKGSDTVSTGVRGPVSLHPAFSVTPVTIDSLQITKSVNSETSDKKSSDTMGAKHRVSFGLYTFFGSINCQLAQKTGFSAEDAEVIHQALLSLFENDASSARPDGSMQVHKVSWWRHDCRSGQYSSARVHRSLSVTLNEGITSPRSYEDFTVTVTTLDGLVLDEQDGR